MSAFIGFIILLILVILGAGIVSSVVLGLGALLSRVFAVSTFEASVVVLVVGAALVWFVTSLGPPGEVEGPEEEDEEEPEEVERMWRATLPMPPVHGRRKKRRR